MKKSTMENRFNQPFPAEAGAKSISISQVKEGHSTQQADELLHELRTYQIELEMQNEELRNAYAALEASRDRYLQLYDLAPVCYLTPTEDGLIIEANLTCGTLLGVERERLINRRFANCIKPEDGNLWYQHFLHAKQNHGKQNCEVTLCRADGTLFHAHLDSVYPEADDAPPLMHITLTDTTEQKQAEKILLEARQRLENQVATTKEELEKHKEETTEINAALKVLLKHRETDKSEAQSALLCEVEETITPFLKKLKGASTGRRQSTHLISIIETNLQHLVDSYGSATTLSAALHHLSPVEIQVASLLRQGLCTKVIAMTLNISPGTVSIHRKHIRKKLGLDSKAANLCAFLKSLTE